ncbi:hypothetical protein [Thalassococcus sp. S3]|uniref:hypothetical protein n=1 Tax=Thalassococcus sp. S3 TaxID=2017482 RepID=UPI00102414DE|nr:hypothetical protein [Thalassococcus sp. S3]QBF34267.1 hypothetical protein CFI11_24075 [Thalassococcus sp. S3]
MTLHLHAGFPKTATTSIQRLFEKHNAALRAQGLCYPLIDGDFKQRYLKEFDHSQFQTADKQAALDKKMADLTHAIEAAGCDDAVLSCEELMSFTTALHRRPNLERLRDALRAIDPDIHLVIYVRNPVDFFLSIAQERVKRSGQLFDPAGFSPNFAAKIALFEEIFETRATVREMNREKLEGGDIVADFLKACGLDRIDISGWEPVSANESLPAEVLFVLEMSRQPLTAGAPVPNVPPKQAEFFWRRIRDLAQQHQIGTKPLLYRNIRDQVLESSAQDIEAMQTRYGITFASGKCAEADGPDETVPTLSKVERLMAVDREIAMGLWAAATQGLARQFLSERERRKAAAS